MLVQSGANVLILDEPTNHLDIESREALEDALRSFPGAILLVSHDRALLDAVGTRTVAVEDRTLHSYLGGWPEYVRVRDERRAAGMDAVLLSGERACALPGGAHAPLRPRHMRRGTSTRVRQRERSGAECGQGEEGQAQGSLQEPPERPAEGGAGGGSGGGALASLEAELADPAAWATRYEAAKSEARHTAARRAVDEAYAHLEALIE